MLTFACALGPAEPRVYQVEAIVLEVAGRKDRGRTAGRGGPRGQWHTRLVLLVVLLISALHGVVGRASTTPVVEASAAPTGLHAAGNQLVDGAGQPVRLRGVNYSGTEYACIQGWGIFDGPSDLVSVQAIASWKANAVRVPLNEDCWLAVNGAPAAYSGANYQTAIKNYVSLLTQNGLVPIVELH